jgi:hypothetical protein
MALNEQVLKTGLNCPVFLYFCIILHTDDGQRSIPLEKNVYIIDFKGKMIK